jgi:hypothetical protein
VLKAWAVVGMVILATLSLTACGLYVAGDAGAYAYTWEDTDCNGQPDEGEAPLQGVCVWYGDPVDSAIPQPDYCASEWSQTDSEGRWDGGLLWNRSCKAVYIFVETPNGFQPTTDTVVNDCFAEFGFAPALTCPERSIMTAADLAARERTIRVTIALALSLGVGIITSIVLLGLLKRQRKGIP